MTKLSSNKVFKSENGEGENAVVLRDKYEHEIYLKCKADPNARPVRSLHDYGTGWEITSLEMAKRFLAEDKESIYRSVLGYVPLANVVKGCAPFNVVLWYTTLSQKIYFGNR